MKSSPFKLLLIADSTIDPIRTYLKKHDENLSPDIAPFDQVVPNLLSDEIGNYSLAVVLTQLERVSPEFNSSMKSDDIDAEKVFSEVREYAAIVKSAAEKINLLVVYNWVLPRWRMVNLLTSRSDKRGSHQILSEANNVLADELRETRNVAVIEQSQLLADTNNTIFDPKMWAIGKILYSSYAFEELAGQIISFVRSASGKTRKLIILDLDNTLWGGILGEIGWENLKLGGLDAIGEAFVLFQRQLKTLRKRGILLAIASKNDEATALEAIDKHPAMVLGRDDFVSWRINWKNKSDNITEIINEVNLGPQSVVFIDDTPQERSLVGEMLPEVLVPDWPEDPVLYPYSLKKLYCFEQLQVTEEDKKRTKMIRGEKKRQASLSGGVSREDWLKNLNVTVRIDKLDEKNLMRAAQLLNRTNQFNLTTRRMSGESLFQWVNESPGRAACVVSASDRFGDYGIIGVISFETGNQSLSICDFLLSCRALGRGVEETMLAYAAREADKIDAASKKVIAEYIPTAKNHPIREFLLRESDEQTGDIFAFFPDRHTTPEYVTVQRAEETE